MLIPKRTGKQKYTIGTDADIAGIVENNKPTKAFAWRNVESLVNNIHCRQKISIPTLHFRSTTYSAGTYTFTMVVPHYGYEQNVNIKANFYQITTGSDCTLTFSTGVDTQVLTITSDDDSYENIEETTFELLSSLAIPSSPNRVAISCTLVVPASVVIGLRSISLTTAETREI